MLSFDQKKALFAEYIELTPQVISLGRINYHFQASAVAKTVVVKGLHPKNGNAYIYAGYLPAAETQDGYLSIYEADEEQIRDLLEKALTFLKKTVDGYEEGYQEKWQHANNGTSLILEYSQPVWLVIFQTDQVEAVFKTKEMAESYLQDEGFFLQN